MSPGRLMTVLVLCLAFLLAPVSGVCGDAGAADPDGLALLQAGHAAVQGGDLQAALDAFLAAAAALEGTDHRAERVAALAAAARLQADGGDLRAALLSWTAALPLADALVATDDPRAELGIFLRLQVTEALRTTDPAGSERFAWDAVQVASGVGTLGVTGLPVAAVLGAAEDEQGVRERIVELDEVLAPIDAYRFHALQRPLPVGYVVHELGTTFARSGDFERAADTLQLAVRTWLALDAVDLAATALVDLGRALTELGELERAQVALVHASWLGGSTALAGMREIRADIATRAGEHRTAEAIWDQLLGEAPGADGARYGSLLARKARVAAPVTALAAHNEAAKILHRAGEHGLAVGERIAAAGRAARTAPDQYLTNVLDLAAAATATKSEVALSPITTAARQLAVAELATRRGELAAARLALGEAGGLQFKVGETEAVAWTASRYVVAALTEGVEPALEALENAERLERDLGLELDGWAALAACATLELARGDAAAAEAAWAEAAMRIERLAILRQHRPVDGVPLPHEAVHLPWIEHLLAADRVAEALDVALRASPVHSRHVADLAIRQQAADVRTLLAQVSTSSGAATPEERRRPLIEEQAALYAALPSRPQCTADGVRALLGAGEVVYVDPQPRGLPMGFIVSTDGVVLVPEHTTLAKLRKMIRPATDLLQHRGSNDSMLSRGHYGPAEFGDLPCDAEWLKAPRDRAFETPPDHRQRATDFVWTPRAR